MPISPLDAASVMDGPAGHFYRRSVTDLASAIEGLQDYDAIERFVTFAEQLDVAADLVRADTLPKARMALVAVDNLADLLLHRHAERVSRRANGPGGMSIGVSRA